MDKQVRWEINIKPDITLWMPWSYVGGAPTLRRGRAWVGRRSTGNTSAADRDEAGTGGGRPRWWGTEMTPLGGGKPWWWRTSARYAPLGPQRISASHSELHIETQPRWAAGGELREGSRIRGWQGRGRRHVQVHRWRARDAQKTTGAVAQHSAEQRPAERCFLRAVHN